MMQAGSFEESLGEGLGDGNERATCSCQPSKCEDDECSAKEDGGQILKLKSDKTFTYDEKSGKTEELGESAGGFYSALMTSGRQPPRLSRVMLLSCFLSLFLTVLPGSFTMMQAGSFEEEEELGEALRKKKPPKRYKCGCKLQKCSDDKCSYEQTGKGKDRTKVLSLKEAKGTKEELGAAMHQHFPVSPIIRKILDMHKAVGSFSIRDILKSQVLGKVSKLPVV